MPEWFYTDNFLAQQGPVDEQTLLDLNETGEIHAKSLVWKKGMEDWVGFGTIAAPLFGNSEEGTPVEIGVCAHSGRVYPLTELIPYGAALIGPEHKDAFVQGLMERSQTEVEDATETQTEYVGFWWRTLSSLLDMMIKMIPSWLCFIPYYIAIYRGIDMQTGEIDGEIGASTDFASTLIITMSLGMLGILALSIWYETWMVGKYQGTLGKLIIGAKVVLPDGGRVSYGRAFLRWLAKKPLNYLISVFIPYMLSIGVVALAIQLEENSDSKEAATALGIIGSMFAFVVLYGICSAIYWMAAFDSEKRAFHDRICGTRVVKK